MTELNHSELTEMAADPTKRLRIGNLDCFALEQADGILLVVQDMEKNEGRARFIPTPDVDGLTDFRLTRILEELSADLLVLPVSQPEVVEAQPEAQPEMAAEPVEQGEIVDDTNQE